MTVAKHSTLNRSAAMASISVALLLVVLKSWAAWSTGSTAMLGSLADTILDLVASFATLIGVSVAAQPSDPHHRFGHGKAEAVAALFQIVLISISALSLGFRAVEQWLGGGRPQAAEEGIAVSVVAMVATLCLLAWQRHVIRRTGSLAITTDHVHYQSDLLLNLAVILALVIDNYLGVAGADPVFGLLIALWLGWGAWNASWRTIDELLDREWPAEKRARFIEVLGHHPETRGAHDLRTRTSGPHDFAQFHLVLDRGMDVAAAHRVTHEIEAKLAREFPGVEVLIHIDPEGLIDETGIAAEELLPEVARRADDGG